MDTNKLFLFAWKRAILASGATGLFYNGDMVDKTTSLKRLAPKVGDIGKRIHVYPKSQATFLAALVSFYNPEEGAKLAKKVGCNGLGDIATNLSHEQRFIIADLLMNHTGW
ncbi:MAG: hypothetical protein KZQ99_02355 [Candidatus Thiodiazotropha sp. (ex Dulcina madagascariensis)]|nr:hypothetical protein [Candidatus Thiodiazotropha sp. (ex Dulcina madagascariensis)]